MEVNKVGSYITQTVQKPEETVRRSTGETKAVPGKETSINPDRVELSKGYQEMAQVKKVIMEEQELRTEKIDQLRKLIDNKAYTVEPDKIAQNMLEEIL